MKVESIAECSARSILQYFRSALSDHWSWKPNLLFFGLAVLDMVYLFVTRILAKHAHVVAPIFLYNVII